MRTSTHCFCVVSFLVLLQTIAFATVCLSVTSGTGFPVSPGYTLGNGASDHPPITPDGRYVTFSTSASNLAAGASTYPRVCIRDLFTGATLFNASTYGLGNRGIMASGNSGLIAYRVGNRLEVHTLNGEPDLYSTTVHGL